MDQGQCVSRGCARRDQRSLVCFKLLKSHIVRIRVDFERLTKEAANNDKQLKENLKAVESTVSALGADKERLRSEAQDSLKEVASYLETLRLGSSGAAAG